MDGLPALDMYYIIIIEGKVRGGGVASDGFCPWWWGR